MLHVRVDDELKARATETLDSMGLSMSDAVRVLLTRIVAEQAFPFPIKVPNTGTKAAMTQARAMGTPRFATADALFDSLDQTAK
jgi:DNA-damage-inducible protein J